jgi:hypothetical protein
LVDDHQLAEAFQARERGEGGLAQMGDDGEGFFACQTILFLGDGRANRRSEEIGNKGGFTSAGDAANDGESADGNLDVEALQVTECGILQTDPFGGRSLAGDRAASTAERVGDGFLEESACHRVGAFLQGGCRALCDDVATMDASARAHVDH